MGWWLLMMQLATAGTVLSHEAVDILGPPIWTADMAEGKQSGWEAEILDSQRGKVRVWNCREESDCVTRFASRVEGLPEYRIPLAADQARGRPGVRVVFREGTLVVDVERPAGDALELADRLFKALKHAGPWPEAPSIRVVEGRLHVTGHWADTAITLSSQLDRSTFLPSTSPVVLDVSGRPRVPEDARWAEVRVWDVYGRSASSRWER